MRIKSRKENQIEKKAYLKAKVDQILQENQMMN